MINMSYCRFQNTLLALRECRNAFVELQSEGGAPLSRDELAAAKRLLIEAAEMLTDVTGNECEIGEDDIVAAIDDVQTWATDNASDADR